jgi:surface antigen
MSRIVRTSPLLLVLLLSACSTSPGTTDVAIGPTLAQPNPALAQPAPLQPAAVTTASVTAATAQTPGAALTDIATFIDAGVVGSLSAKDKAEAASAQFNALTFSRPGAPRAWAGDDGATGQVLVGPYVRVNNIDCRDFTHTVTVAGKAYPRKGMACRDADGTWRVES